MKDADHKLSLFCMTVLCLFGVGCSKVLDRPPVDKNPPAIDMVQLLKEREKEQNVWPVKLSITPDTIRVINGHAQHGSYRLDYEMENPEIITEANLKVESECIESVNRYLEIPDIPIRKRGTIYLTLNIPEDVDFGPKILIRAKCPEGESDWYAFGGVNPEYTLRNAPPGQIVKIVPRDSNGYITLYGNGFNKDCSAEAEVSGKVFDLKTAWSLNGQIKAHFSSNAINDRPMCPRAFRVGLTIAVPSKNNRYAANAFIRFEE